MATWTSAVHNLVLLKGLKPVETTRKRRLFLRRGRYHQEEEDANTKERTSPQRQGSQQQEEDITKSKRILPRGEGRHYQEKNTTKRRL